MDRCSLILSRGRGFARSLVSQWGKKSDCLLLLGVSTNSKNIGLWSTGEVRSSTRCERAFKRNQSRSAISGLVVLLARCYRPVILEGRGLTSPFNVLRKCAIGSRARMPASFQRRLVQVKLVEKTRRKLACDAYG